MLFWKTSKLFNNSFDSGHCPANGFTLITFFEKAEINKYIKQDTESLWTFIVSWLLKCNYSLCGHVCGCMYSCVFRCTCVTGRGELAHIWTVKGGQRSAWGIISQELHILLIEAGVLSGVVLWLDYTDWPTSNWELSVSASQGCSSKFALPVWLFELVLGIELKPTFCCEGVSLDPRRLSY